MPRVPLSAGAVVGESCLLPWSLEASKWGDQQTTKLYVSKYMMTNCSRCSERAAGGLGRCPAEKLWGGESTAGRGEGPGSTCKGPAAERGWTTPGPRTRPAWQTVVVAEEGPADEAEALGGRPRLDLILGELIKDLCTRSKKRLRGEKFW